MRVIFRLGMVLFITALAAIAAIYEGVRLYGHMTAPHSAAGGFGAGGYSAPEADVATLKLGEITPTITAYGRIVSRSQITVVVPESGPVVEVADGLTDGAPVTKGQLLFRLDDREANADLQEAKADLEQARIAYTDNQRAEKVLEDALPALQEILKIRNAALDRQASLMKSGSGLQSDYETAKLEVISAQQDIDSNRSDLADLVADAPSLKLDIDKDERAVDSAQSTLDDTRITAGIDGSYHGDVPVVGETLSSGDEPGLIADLNKLEVKLDLSSLEIARVTGKDGKILPLDVTLKSPGSGKEYAAKLDHFALTASDDTEMERQAVAVIDPAACPCPLPGEFVAATIHEPPLKNVAILPSTAVSYDGKVLVVGPDNKLTDTQMTVLRRIGDQVALKNPGESFEYVKKRTPQLGTGISITPVHEGETITSAGSGPGGPGGPGGGGPAGGPPPGGGGGPGGPMGMKYEVPADQGSGEAQLIDASFQE